jgi:hypothetical protein
MNTDPNYKSVSQQFIDRYRELQKSSGDKDDDEIFKEVTEQLASSGMLQTSRQQPRASRRGRSDHVSPFRGRQEPRTADTDLPEEDSSPSKEQRSLDINDLLK